MLIFYVFGFVIFLNEKLKFLGSVKIWVNNVPIKGKSTFGGHLFVSTF